METIKDLIKSFGEWFRDRFTNPLFPAFVAAWLFTNWRVLLVVFGEGEYSDKVEFLDQKLYPHLWQWFVYGLVAPLLEALAYVWLSPPVLRAISEYHRRQRHLHTAAMLRADAIQPISPEEAERIVRERVEARLKLKAEQARFSALENDYLDQLQKLRDELAAASRLASMGLPDTVTGGVTRNDTLASEVKSTQPIEQADLGPRIFRFTAGDFVVKTGKLPTQLIEKGLTEEELEILHVFRNGDQIESSRLTGKDRFRLKLALGKIETMGLLYEYNDTYRILDVGLQALEAAAKHGFVSGKTSSEER